MQRSLPKSVTLTLVRDDSKFIYASIASLEEHLIFGSLFAAIVVMFFIRNLRAVIISALAIPASIISTFTLMGLMGFTLNNMTLLGITLAVGIVIDDAIVVLENIFRYIEEKNCTPFDAAIQGTREVALAVMATTLSLVVIFLPIAFMNGYAKRFINPFGWTMAFSIMVSMLVSFTLTPMLSSRLLKLADAQADHKTKEQGFFHWLDTWYARQVNWALDHSGLIIAMSAIVFMLTFPLNRMVGREFAPDEDLGEWTIHMDAPEGTSLEGSQEMAFKLLKEVAGDPRRRQHRAARQPRRQRRRRRRRRQQRDARALQRAGAADRRAQADAGADDGRDASAAGEVSGLPPEPHLTQRVGQRGRGGRLRISLNVLGPDLPQLADYSLRVLGAAQKTPSLADPKLSLSVSNPEIHVAVDRAPRRRSRRPDGDHRQHAPAGGVGRRSRSRSTRKGRSSTR